MVALPAHQVVRVPPTGHITAMKIKPGDKIKSGDVVAELSTFSLKAETDGFVAKTFGAAG